MSAAELRLAHQRAVDVVTILDRLLAAPAPPPERASAAPPSAGAASGLRHEAAFYEVVRGDAGELWPKMLAKQYEGCQTILGACAGAMPASWTAYALATSYHETAYTMQPIRERGSGDGPDADSWDDYLEKYDTGGLAAKLGNTPEADGDGVLYAGRGYVQLTGRRNYAHATERLRALGLDVDLSAQPDLALRPDVASVVLVRGMLEGWFTGKKLRDYLPATPTLAHFTNARRIINGTDRAALIAGYAMKFYSALVAGEWQ
jgi:putative chitinase